jgi:hypothetical protein
MATSASGSEFSSTIEGAAAFDRERKAKADASLREIAGSAMELGDSLLQLFTTLPAAMLGARRAEYERVAARHGEDHPRTKQVRASLGALDGVVRRSAAGRDRAMRGLEALRTPGGAFFGFVADGSGRALAKMTVQLTGDAVGKDAQGVSADDGFFRVPLRPGASAGVAGSESFATMRAAILGGEDTEREAGAEKPVATVRILNARGQVVHEDPVPLELEAGSAYREYRIEDTPMPQAKDEPDKPRATSARRKRART